MAVAVVMPKFGLTMDEGTIKSWLKAEGEAVRRGEPLFEVETEKVLTEVEAPADGVVACILEPVEAVVAVGVTVAVIAEAGEAAGEVAARWRDGMRAEVRAAESAGGGEGETGAGVEVVRLTGMRATIAERMARSLREAPQLTLTTAVDVTELVALRRRLEAEFPVTVNDLVLAATVRALVAHPRMNAHLVGDEVRISRRVHLGVAVAVEDGLVVPVIRDAGSLGLRELAARARDLGERARTGSLGVEDVSGGTFTVTNLGALGIDTFTPILNPPQVGILGVGRVAPRPWAVDGTVRVRDVLSLSLTFDHRALDGAPAARFLAEAARLLGEEASSLCEAPR
jgi:pyruvate dehydrogenase E2 component (dihydrolipoamide acetyltransferase)